MRFYLRTLKSVRFCLEVVPFPIHTWLQPGDHATALRRKPFKRFPLNFELRDTWLKPCVNENNLLISPRTLILS